MNLTIHLNREETLALSQLGEKAQGDRTKLLEGFRELLGDEILSLLLTAGPGRVSVVDTSGTKVEDVAQ